MASRDKALIAKEWITKLAKGINPIDGSSIREDDIVNNVHISRCLFYVADLIDDAVKRPKRPGFEFNLSPEEISNVTIVDKTSITLFTKEINRVIPVNMKPIASRTIIGWLLSNGYMESVLDEEGKKTNLPTELGNSIGITTEVRGGFDIRPPYLAVVYDSNAQRFILDNINSVAKDG